MPMRPAQVFQDFHFEQSQLPNGKKPVLTLTSLDGKVKFEKFTFNDAILFEPLYVDENGQQVPHILLGKVTRGLASYKAYWNMQKHAPASFILAPTVKPRELNNEHEYELFSALQIDNKPSLFHLLLELNKGGDLEQAFKNWMPIALNQFKEKAIENKLYAALQKLFGITTQANKPEAISDLIALCDDNQPPLEICLSSLILGLCYLQAEGTKRNVKAATTCFDRALHQPIGLNLQSIIRSHIQTTLHTFCDDKNITAAEKAPCKTSLGLMLEHVNNAAAIKLLEEGFADGDESAGAILGAWYEKGYHQTEPDYKKALETYAEAIKLTFVFEDAEKLMDTAFDASKKALDATEQYRLCKFNYATRLCLKLPEIVISKLQADKFSLLTESKCRETFDSYLKKSAEESSVNYPSLISYYNLNLIAQYENSLTAHQNWVVALTKEHKAFDVVAVIDSLETLRSHLQQTVHEKIDGLIATVLDHQSMYLPKKLTEFNLLIERLAAIARLVSNPSSQSQIRLATAHQKIMKCVQTALDKAALKANVSKDYHVLDSLGATIKSCEDPTFKALQQSAGMYTHHYHSLQVRFSELNSNEKKIKNAAIEEFRILKDAAYNGKQITQTEEAFLSIYKLWAFTEYATRNLIDNPEIYVDILQKNKNIESQFALINYYFNNQAKYKKQLDRLEAGKDSIQTQLFTAMESRWLGLYHEDALKFSTLFCNGTILSEAIKLDFAHLKHAYTIQEFRPTLRDNKPENILASLDELLCVETRLCANTRHALIKYATLVYSKLNNKQQELYRGQFAPYQSANARKLFAIIEDDETRERHENEALKSQIKNLQEEFTGRNGSSNSPLLTFSITTTPTKNSRQHSHSAPQNIASPTKK